MSTTVKDPKISLKQPEEITKVAEEIGNSAINEALLKLTPVGQKKDLAALFQKHNFFCLFKSALAEEVGSVLGDFDSKVTEVYFFEPCMNTDIESGDDLPIDGTLNLLLVVKTQTAGLDAFIASLDRALTQTIKELPLPIVESYDSILNIIPVTQKDIDARKGYAALLSSLYAPPLKVWQRL
ncbi:hypothetical protein ACFLYP_00185 [Chloroflexota bacterium]